MNHEGAGPRINLGMAGERAPVKRAPVRRLQTLLLLFMLLAMFGSLLNLLICDRNAKSGIFPIHWPSRWGLKYWYQGFQIHTAMSSSSLLTSALIALLSVGFCSLISVTAGYALSRRKMPLRMLFMLLIPYPAGLS